MDSCVGDAQQRVCEHMGTWLWPHFVTVFLAFGAISGCPAWSGLVLVLARWVCLRSGPLGLSCSAVLWVRPLGRLFAARSVCSAPGWRPVAWCSLAFQSALVWLLFHSLFGVFHSGGSFFVSPGVRSSHLATQPLWSVHVDAGRTPMWGRISTGSRHHPHSFPRVALHLPVLAPVLFSNLLSTVVFAQSTSMKASSLYSECPKSRTVTSGCPRTQMEKDSLDRCVAAFEVETEREGAGYVEHKFESAKIHEAWKQTKLQTEVNQKVGAHQKAHGEPAATLSGDAVKVQRTIRAFDS